MIPIFKKLIKSDKEKLLGELNYDYNTETKKGAYFIQFDLYAVECDEDYFNKIGKAVDWWNSINPNERHHFLKLYDEAGGDFDYKFRRGFVESVIKVMQFNKLLT